MQHTGYSENNAAANYPKVLLSLKTLCHDKLVYDNKKLVYRFDGWRRPRRHPLLLRRHRRSEGLILIPPGHDELPPGTCEVGYDGRGVLGP